MLPGRARAQSTGNIAGLVTDATGAILPGVTVETASPALIEKTRTVTTDAQGRYLVEALPAGTYTVTFTIPGFRTVVREGIQLSTGFTATVNAELAVGSVEETRDGVGRHALSSTCRTSGRRTCCSARCSTRCRPTSRCTALRL